VGSLGGLGGGLWGGGGGGGRWWCGGGEGWGGVLVGVGIGGGGVGGVGFGVCLELFKTPTWLGVLFVLCLVGGFVFDFPGVVCVLVFFKTKQKTHQTPPPNTTPPNLEGFGRGGGGRGGGVAVGGVWGGGGWRWGVGVWVTKNKPQQNNKKKDCAMFVRPFFYQNNVIGLDAPRGTHLYSFFCST